MKKNIFYFLFSLSLLQSCCPQSYEDAVYDSYKSYSGHTKDVIIYRDSFECDTIIDGWHIRYKNIVNEDVVQNKHIDDITPFADYSLIILLRKNDRLVFKTHEFRAKDFDVFDGHPEKYQLTSSTLTHVTKKEVVIENFFLMPDSDWGALIRMHFYDNGDLEWEDVDYWSDAW